MTTDRQAQLDAQLTGGLVRVVAADGSVWWVRPDAVRPTDRRM